MDKLHVYTTVWNEVYMMKYFLRYYETVADRIFVLDDNSDDGTRELVETCPKATLLQYPYPTGFNEYDKTECLSKEYIKYSRGSSDWVACVDCDEFLYHKDLRGLLDQRRAMGFQSIGSTGLFFLSEEIPDTDGQLFDAMPYTFRKRSWDKEVLFDPKLDVTFTLGSHPPTVFNPPTISPRCGVYMFHCCYLSRQWIIDHLGKRISRMTDPVYKKKFVDEHDFLIRKACRLYDNIIAEWKEKCQK